MFLHINDLNTPNFMSRYEFLNYVTKLLGSSSCYLSATCCPLPMNSGVRGLVKKEKESYLKTIQFWKNNGLLPQSLFPLKHSKANNPSPSASSVQRCSWNPFSYFKIPFFVIHRWLQHNYPGGLEVTVWLQAPL